MDKWGWAEGFHPPSNMALGTALFFLRYVRAWLTGCGGMLLCAGGPNIHFQLRGSRPGFAPGGPAATGDRLTGRLSMVFPNAYTVQWIWKACPNQTTCRYGGVQFRGFSGSNAEHENRRPPTKWWRRSQMKRGVSYCEQVFLGNHDKGSHISSGWLPLPMVFRRAWKSATFGWLQAFEETRY